MNIVKIGSAEIDKDMICGMMPARDSKPGALKVLVFLTSGQTLTIPVKDYPEGILAKV